MRIFNLSFFLLPLLYVIITQKNKIASFLQFCENFIFFCNNPIGGTRMQVSIGNILKNMRSINTNFTQKDIGIKMAIADNTISSYERENSQPDFQTIINYAELCDFEIKIFNKKTNEEVSLEELSKEL